MQIPACAIAISPTIVEEGEFYGLRYGIIQHMDGTIARFQDPDLMFMTEAEILKREENRNRVASSNATGRKTRQLDQAFHHMKEREQLH